MLYQNKLYWINNINGADYLVLGVASMCRRKFQTEKLIGAEFGTALGGGPEAIGKLWKGIGEIHAFDVFEYHGHPKELSLNPDGWEYKSMLRWYDNRFAGKWRIPYITPEMWSHEYQRKALDDQSLDNVILHKGLINEDSLKDVPYLHYALLDMDLVVSMKTGYEAVKNKIKKGGFLALHDCNPRGHIEGLWEIYQEILASGEWKEVIHCDTAYLIVLEKL